jgi:hypothetical protein
MSTETAKNQERIGKGNPPKVHRFKPGQSGNPSGRPKGKRNFYTDFSEAWRRVAEQLRLNKEPDEGVIQILIHGLKKISKGDTKLIEHFLDRIYGKVKDEAEIEIKKKLIILDE